MYAHLEEHFLILLEGPGLNLLGELDHRLKMGIMLLVLCGVISVSPESSGMRAGGTIARSIDGWRKHARPGGKWNTHTGHKCINVLGHVVR